MDKSSESSNTNETLDAHRAETLRIFNNDSWLKQYDEMINGDAVPSESVSKESETEEFTEKENRANPPQP